MIKRFIEWIGLKEKLHNKNSKPPFVSKGDVSWFVEFMYKEKRMFACLHQARAVDYRRLFSKLGTLDDEDFNKVKIGFDKLYK